VTILGFHRWRVMSPGIAMEMSNIWTRHWNEYSSMVKYVIWINKLSFWYIIFLYIFYFSIFLFWGVKWSIKVTFFLFSTCVFEMRTHFGALLGKTQVHIIRRKKLWIECFSFYKWWGLFTATIYRLQKLI